jgi:hypothetical protein
METLEEEMRKGDILWIMALAVWVVILAVPISREAFLNYTTAHPYIGGFVKFAILASMGDLLGARISRGYYLKPSGFFLRGFVWGIFGMMVVIVFAVFMGGTSMAQASGLLPFQGSKLAQAFMGSAIMNLSFGPMLMAVHRMTDTYIDMIYEKVERKGLSDVVERIDWHSVVEFSWAKACIFFWIPAHTLVFILPGEIRVLASAFLSIALGLLLAIAKRKNQPA